MLHDALSSLDRRASCGTRLFLCLLCCLTARGVWGLTVVLPPDELLIQQSDLIVVARIVPPAGTENSDAEAIRFLRIDDVLRAQGPVPDVGSVIALRMPGVPPEALGRGPTMRSGSTAIVPGLPLLESGREVVAFLGPPRGRVRNLVHLNLGLFRRTATFTNGGAQRGPDAARRDLAHVHVISPPGSLSGTTKGTPRMRAWGPWIEAIRNWSARAPRLEAQPIWLAGSHHLGESKTLHGATETFTFIGGSPVRWFEFDNGGSVSIRAHESGLAGATDVFGSTRVAIAAWNNDLGSNVRLSYGGTTTAGSGLRARDGVSTILWDDPSNEIEGSYVCGQGGAVGLGGGFTQGNGTWPNGSAGRLVEGDIVINDGAGCFFDRANRRDGQEILAHEIGHTLGLGHTSTAPGDSLMRSTAHGDGRGARLGRDEEDGLAFLYPVDPATVPGTIEVALPQISITEGLDAAVEVRRVGGRAGTVRVDYATLAGTATAGLDFTPTSGTLTWLDGDTNPRQVVINTSQDELDEPDETLTLELSGVVGASLGARLATLRILDDDVATPTGNLTFATATASRREIDGSHSLIVRRSNGTDGAASVRVRVRSSSATENRDFRFTEVELDWGPGEGGTRSVAVQLLVDEDIELPETVVFELVDATGARIGGRDRHTLEILEALPPGPCPSRSTTLCLVEDRFRVEAQWSRGATSQGDGNGDDLTGDTGTFWFFDPSNVELTVKVLDACVLFDRYWVFVAGLTDLEVRLRVTDTAANQSRVYANQDATPFSPVQDTSAFTTCP